MDDTERYLYTLPDKGKAEIGLLVNHIIRDAIAARASDIHVEPWEDSVAVRIRVSGQLLELVHLPAELKERLSGRFKILANLVSHLSGVAQDGKANMGPDYGHVQLRVSIIPTIRGEKIVCRIFDPNTRSFDLESLGVEPQTLQALVTLINKPNGLLLLTGPTGSGKTTVIYAALQHLIMKHGTTISIASVEDPVEVPLPTVCQVQLNTAQDFNFAAALRALMRQDPQVIMVGEIRDMETANIAVQAGLTGHLVISTIHSGTTAGVFARLINMGIEPFLLASSILGVMGVRLVRQNCTACAQPYQPDLQLRKQLTPDDLKGALFLRGKGCDECHGTGFNGRMSLTELLTPNEQVREAVLEKKPSRMIQNIAVEYGMRTLWHCGVARACQGKTTLEEVARKVASDQL